MFFTNPLTKPVLVAAIAITLAIAFGAVLETIVYPRSRVCPGYRAPLFTIARPTAIA